MALKREFNRLLHSELNCHAAWPPLANSFALGDYGLFDDGVFQRLGNVSEYGATFKSSESVGAALKLSSEKTREIEVKPQVDLAGGLPGIAAIPSGQAQLQFHFEKDDSIVIRAADVRLQEIEDIQQLAQKLAKIPQWKTRFKVVRQVWTVRDALVLAARSGNSQVSLQGDIDAVRALQRGKVEASMSVHSSGDVAFEMVGRSGNLGVGLFRLRLIGDTPRLLGDAPTSVDVQIDTQVTPDSTEDF